MKTTREQYNTQKARAQQTANFYGRPLDLVIVREKGYPDRVSIIGNAISRATAESWKDEKTKVRTICKIYPQTQEA